MSTKITCKECNNSACFIKKYCPSDWLNRIELKKNQIEHPAKDSIFREGSYVGGIYFIQQGIAKIVIKGADKREQIIRLATEGDMLGYRGVGNDKHHISAITLSDAIICYINNDTLYKVLINNPKLAIQMIEFYSYELRKTDIRMQYHTQMNLK